MTVMNIDQLIEASKKVGEGNLFDILMDDEVADRKMKHIKQIAETLDANAEKAKEIILAKISEKTFVELARVVQNGTLTALASAGDFELLDAHMSGVLKGYTHTVILATIGILIEEEVL